MSYAKEYIKVYGEPLCPCGKRANHIHHIVFRSRGGTDDLSNLIGLCESCHDRAHFRREPYIGTETLLSLNERK